MGRGLATATFSDQRSASCDSAPGADRPATRPRGWPKDALAPRWARDTGQPRRGVQWGTQASHGRVSHMGSPRAGVARWCGRVTARPPGLLLRPSRPHVWLDDDGHARHVLLHAGDHALAHEGTNFLGVLRRSFDNELVVND